MKWIIRLFFRALRVILIPAVLLWEKLTTPKGMVRTLAEPTLVTMSGDTASFLAGGEFPIPVPQDQNTVTIEWTGTKRSSATSGSSAAREGAPSSRST